MRTYRDFDLPKIHLAEEGHFVPPKARDEAEIERRRAQRPGRLVLQQQQRGTEMARDILGRLSHPDDINFGADVLAVCGLNTAWYLMGKGADVQRRRLKLEVLATEDPEQRPSSLMLLTEARGDFNRATQVGQELLDTSHLHEAVVAKNKRSLGRMIGHGSLTLACVAIGDRVGYESSMMSDFDVQALARERGLQLVENARAMQVDLRTAPSLAGLANPDSDIAVFWRREAPNEALEAWEYAFDQAA